VWVAVSGGADSAVAAALSLETADVVAGATMRLAPPGAFAYHDAAIEAAAAVCGFLGIAHHIFDMTAEFDEVVVGHARSRQEGLTPNPCVLCNVDVKFGAFLTRCLDAGAGILATGHYARVLGIDGRLRLARGLDLAKDQSYFLYRLDSGQLSACRFPLGEKTKEWTLAKAADLGLPVLDDESQDLCIPERFATSHEGHGAIVHIDGSVLGSHTGVAGFTVGQRKGLGLGTGAPLYVVDIDPVTATVTVGDRRDILRTRLMADDVVWQGRPSQRCAAQIRYRSTATDATAVFDGQLLEIAFDSPVEAPAPGQSVVCYDGDVVVGGGVIQSAR
jgi:tRNA-specific 2-thiouridylase